ncbi:SWF or SNF family helicase [Streptomyces sp. NPDC058045]|uniref:SWIM zinc finger family protein n=1 Tax=Streptomyces sp. NPDC058045 TaxID=3346311 RepID=UPI0036E32ECF
MDLDGTDDDTVTEMTEPERTFAALPPARGRGFARTWWGHAWLKALEDTALDGTQLKAGRGLARAGAVGAVSVRPGRITAIVRERDGSAHRADVLLHRLDDEGWRRFLGMAVERAGHVAALLEREMPPQLVADAAEAGLELLPGIGELEPECECGAWDHCAHTAALSYQMARLVDEDSFVLLLMRGRGEGQLLDALRTLHDRQAEAVAHTEDGGAAQAAQDGVEAAAVLAAERDLPPLPDLPPDPELPGLPPPLDMETGPAADVEVPAVEFLGRAAAVTAYGLLATLRAAHIPVGSGLHEAAAGRAGLTEHEDAVRLAAAGRGRPATEPGPRTSDSGMEEVMARLAAVGGRTGSELEAAVLAWEFGGVAGLEVWEEQWVPDERAAALAVAAVADARSEGEVPDLTASGNRWTTGDGRVQIRYGQGGAWWPFHRPRHTANGTWTPAGGPCDGPGEALSRALEEAEAER